MFLKSQNVCKTHDKEDSCEVIEEENKVEFPDRRETPPARSKNACNVTMSFQS